MSNSPATPEPQEQRVAQQPSNKPDDDSGPTALQLGIAIVILGTSAGFTLYTKRAGAMLRGMEKMQETQLRKHPPRIGPHTKEEWEKLRPRIDKDEFF